jgi:hypothetical protein
VVNILDREIKLILVAFRIAAIFGAAVGQHPLEWNLVLVVEGEHAVVQQVGRSDRRLAVIKLGKPDLGIGVDEGLLVDPAHAFEVADVKGVLRAAVV